MAVIILSRDGHDIAGTTANRPTNCEPGQLYYDTTVDSLYCANSTGGMRSVPGHIGVLTVAALGTNQGTAAALNGGSLNHVTGADGTKGVILPTITIGDTIQVENASTSVLKVYPTGTNTIASGSASASVNVAPNSITTFVGATATNWATDVAQSDTGAVTVDSITAGTTPFTITGQNATGTAAGGAVTITAGAGSGGTSAGGNLNLVGGAAVSTGVPGEVQVAGDSNISFVTEVLTATDVTRTLFVAPRPMRLKSAKVVWTTGSTSGAFTLEKCTGTTAPGSGTVLLTGTVTLAGTGNTVGTGTLIATVASLTLAAGDRLGIVISGTMTNLVGCRLTAGLNPC